MQTGNVEANSSISDLHSRYAINNAVKTVAVILLHLKLKASLNEYHIHNLF